MTREEQKLAKLVRRKPEEGMKKCIDRYGSGVKSVCRGILREGNRSYVEDAVNETFISLWQFLNNGKKTDGKLEAYVYGIARKKSLEIVRRNTKQEHSMSLDAMEGAEQLLVAERADVETNFARRQNEKLLHELVNGLEEPDRTIFLLRYFYFFRLREIADRLLLPEDNVESRIRRGREKLKKLLLAKGVFKENEG